MANKYTSEPIELGSKYQDSEFYRAEILLHGVDHSGISYEGRIFLNNPDADEDTDPTVENGYGGSYYVFGHGKCYGDTGHCVARKSNRPYDLRMQHPLVPLDVAVTVTDAFRKVLGESDRLTVTIVPVIHTPDEELDMDTCLKFNKFDLLVYAP